jgi:FtsH-binding integral membrane protein
MKDFIRTLMMVAMCVSSFLCMCWYSELMYKGDAPINSCFVPFILYMAGLTLSVIIPLFVTEYLWKFFGLFKIKI